MEDEELIALKESKDKLAKKALNLIKKLKDQENNQEIVTIKLPSTQQPIHKARKELSNKEKLQLCYFSSDVNGIVFEGTDQKWLHDNIYKYTTTAVSSELNVFVELEVKIEDKNELEICNILYHLEMNERSKMLEIEPWVQATTKMKNFSLLISAMSQYSERSTFRTKILNKLKASKYVDCENCTDKNGGVLVNIHSAKDAKLLYLIFQWSVKFIEQNWGVEHYLVITPTETGAEFMDENYDFLKKFCTRNIENKELHKLWHQLCSLIKSYEDKGKRETDNTE